MVLSILSGRRRTRTISMGRPIKIGNFDFLLPSNRAEHWTFAWVAITAGICEEMLFRVLVIYVLQHQFPSLSWGMIVAITALIFGMAHLYQGWIGIVGTGLLGAVLAIIYLSFAPRIHNKFLPRKKAETRMNTGFFSIIRCQPN